MPNLTKISRCAHSEPDYPFFLVMNSLIRTAVYLLSVLLIASCATAPGSRFHGVSETPSSSTDLYIYRQRAFFASGQKFNVLVDGRSVGALFNESFLLLRMNPGVHTLTVEPGGPAKISNITVYARPGEKAFFEFDFATGPLANLLFIGSAIEARAIEKAIEEMRDLRAASSDTSVRVETEGRFASVDDVDAVPLLDVRGREGYREWLKKSPPRAFVLGPDGRWNATWGLNPVITTDPTDPTQRALGRCNARGTSQCKVYAIDNLVVWRE